MSHSLSLYHTLLAQIGHWLPHERVTRQRNLALLVMGVYLSSSVHLSFIVGKWPLAAKVASLANRLRRFLSNEAVVTQQMYQPLAAQLIAAFAGHPLRLVMDVTQVGNHHRALVVGIAYRRRTLPLGWSVHRGHKGNVTVRAQIALLRQVWRLIPYSLEVHLVADGGFESSDLLFWLRRAQWHWVIRQGSKITVRPEGEGWQRLGDMVCQEGERRVVGWVWRAKTNPFGPAWLVIYWKKGEEHPWFLLSDQPEELHHIIAAYGRRMWIEEMFGDMKANGFDLEATRLQLTERIQRLLLGVCIAYVWLIALGSWVVKNGYRHLIDRKDRRDKSYFRLGGDWIQRCLRLALPIRLCFIPYL